jgi:hypothetical protein
MISKIKRIYNQANYTKKSNKFKDLLDAIFLAFLFASIAVNIALLTELIKRLDIIIKNLPNQ